MSNSLPNDDIDLTIREKNGGKWLAFFIQEDPRLPPREMSVEEGLLYMQLSGVFGKDSTIKLGKNFWACGTEDEVAKHRADITGFLQKQASETTQGILSK